MLKSKVSPKPSRKPFTGALIEDLSPPLPFCTAQAFWTEPILALRPSLGEPNPVFRSRLSVVLTLHSMSEALHLVGSRYNVITLIFFFPYVLSQPLAIVVLRKIGPRTFLSTIALLWGATEIVSH